MRARRDDIPAGAAVERALTQGLCGVGGLLEPAPRTLEAAVEAMRQQHDERQSGRLRRFAAVDDGAYVWTRDVDDMYWLGRLAGAWRYDDSPAAVKIDLVHVRPCQWLKDAIADASVPAGVLATFARGGRNWQQTHDYAAAEQSARLWDTFGG